MPRPSDSRPSELPPNELRKLKSRYADLNGTSPAMRDPNLPQDAKDLIQKQAHDKLVEQGWIETEKESPDARRHGLASLSLADIAISILTFGIF